MFIETFRHYLESRTDAPPDFHYHAAMAALSLAMGSNVWCDGWGRPLYPNIWSIIIAPSGYGKSVPLDFAEAIARKAGLGQSVLPNSFSQEALLSELSHTPTGAFFLQEFSAFVRGLEREYNAGATQWLTELYDVPADYKRTIMRKGNPEQIVITKPCLTILGASSPSWFADTFKEGSLSGGFLARFLFCPSTKVGKYVGHPGPRDEGMETGLAGHLQMLSKLEGKADFSGVRSAFNDWDREIREKIRSAPPDEFSGMRSRMGMMVLKCAMLIHGSEDPESLVINKSDLDKSISYVTWCTDKAEKYLSEEVARDKYEAERQKLIAALRRAGGELPWAKALMNTRLTARIMTETVETLTQTGQIRLQSGVGKGTLVLREMEHKLKVVGA